MTPTVVFGDDKSQNAWKKSKKGRKKEGRRGERRSKGAREESADTPHPRLFEMLQKITGSGMKGCTVGGQERRNTEEEEEEEKGEERQTRLTQQ